MHRQIAESAYKNAKTPRQWETQHERMKAKLIGFINPGQIPWVYEDSDQSVPAQYARAIAAYKKNNVQEALRRIDALLEQEPDNPYFLELKGQMLVDFGQVPKALPFYLQAIDAMPQAALIRIAYAHALIEAAGQTDQAKLHQAIDELERAMRDEPRSTRVHRLLATAHGRLGQENEAKIHLAEEAVMQGRYDYARQHAQSVLTTTEQGSSLWIRAQDIVSYVETVKKG